jgi:DNA-binding NarL/FixJ family response regulator
MNLGRRLPPLQLEREQRQQLEAMANSRSLPDGLVTRVRIVLLSADGLSNRDIAARLRVNRMTVGLWRGRFMKLGLDGIARGIASWPPAFDSR